MPDSEDGVSDELHEALVRAANHSSPCQRVLRHHEGRQVATRPMDFYTALKRVDQLVVRLDTGRPGDSLLPIDCRYHEGAIEFTHAHRDVGVTGRRQFLDDVRSADSVDLLAHDASQFAAGESDADQEVATDGGTETVLACPSCDRASVQHASNDYYRCEVCNETFTEPVERERRAAARLRGDSVASVLDEADPGDLMPDGGTETTSGPGGAGKCPQGCHHPVAGNETLEYCEETIPLDPPDVFEVYGETVVQTERVRRYHECIVCGWVIDL